MHGMADRTIAARPTRQPFAAGFVLAGLCLVAFALLVLLRPGLPGNEAALDAILLWQSLMPRAVLSLIVGAALGLSGLLLQRVLRNPIADASTLGIASGAELALTLAMSFSPLLPSISRELAAFAGGLAAVAIVLALSWRRGLDPVTVALSGMIVTLITSALSVTVILARGEYAMSIYIWGAGSLSQQDWNGVISLAPRLAIGFAAAVLLIRPLRVLSLDDTGARSLGVALRATRFAVLALDRAPRRRANHRTDHDSSAADGRRAAVFHRLHHAAARPRLHRSCACRSGNGTPRRSAAALSAATRSFLLGRHTSASVCFSPHPQAYRRLAFTARRTCGYHCARIDGGSRR
jgi:ABC-type cobalamin transport system permease subunit